MIKEEENENIKINENQKKQLRIFAKKIEEIISEFKNRKKLGTKINEEDNLKNIDFKQYDEFFEKIEKQKNTVKAYKLKLENDAKYIEIIEKQDELKYLNEEFKKKKKEYDYLIETSKNLDKFQNNYLNDEIRYYKGEIDKMKKYISEKNNEYMQYNNIIKEIRKEMDDIDKKNNSVKDNIEFIRWEINFNNNLKLLEKKALNENQENYKEEMEKEKAAAKLQRQNIRDRYNEIYKQKKDIENEVKDLEKELSKYKYEEKINNMKIKEIQKIENKIKLNTIKEKGKKNNLKKIQMKEKWLNSKRIENIMAESLKNNFSIKNNYLQLLEEDKRQINIKKTKPGLTIAKNKMVKSNSSIDVFKTKREVIKQKREKEKEEFMKNFDKDLKKYEEQKGEVIQEIKSLREEIEKSLNNNGINDNFINNIKKEDE